MLHFSLVTKIINIDKTLILTLPRKQTGHPVGYYTSIDYISTKMQSRHLWRPIHGLLTMAMLVGQLMGVKDPSKARNQRVAKSRIVLISIVIPLILIVVKKFGPRQLIHGCIYCSVNNTNESRLLVSMCFWVNKGIDGRTNQFEKTLCTG